MRAVVLVLAAGLAAGGCTATAAGPPASGAASFVSAVAPASPVRVASSGRVAPAPQMTPVDPLRCSTTTVRGPGSGPLRIDGRWRPDPDALPDETVTVTRGPDADSCAGNLPPQPYCSQAIPWTGLSVDALVHASGAQRWVSSAVPGPDGRGGAGAPRDPYRVPRSMTYTVMTPRPGGRLAIGPALTAGASACASTTARTAGGVTVLRGTTVDRWAPATGGPPTTATFIAVIGPSGVAWAQLGGPAWPEQDIESALAALRAALARSR